LKAISFENIKTILKGKTVGIAGAGGLGSNCAVALARVGVGKLIIADFDVVSESNLNRQYYFHDQIGQMKVDALKANIGRINPVIQVEVHALKLNGENIPQLFVKCDVIVEAFDVADQKQLLIETILSAFPEMPLVVGLGMAGYGETNLLKVRSAGNIIICGDETHEVSETKPPLAPRVGIVANMQANVVLEILLNL